ncbi:hypothetical protein EHQ12_12755 [Leptospira gomenensis]|uniref:Uncharacterized protein n=2 Tax=Leptospira gomenensis TaxID=2484974 RepID=A0A5F1YQB1_9LEPT|nr:hypothetical protein EHQ17_19210 [Leptospira gomenensis]TGK37215.1 hypothetical protein EHQ12_12755 [Leptospira gomenensis]TGK45881.1 hypothetical protein EHQ07_07770 [Leptospira gomenensis]TGK59778.1 hypothetical protein EHQ13_11980 [Leptospira gomenensis]
MRLQGRKDEFRKILSALNRHYAPVVSESKKLGSQKLRFELEKRESDDFDVFFKKIGTYDFAVVLKSGNRFDSWIHLDGIREEQERFLFEGKNDHPIFQIVCLSDLYETDCVLADLSITKTEAQKDSA